ncbi:hypothetical protein SCUCBS95973_001546 [Sporothrix curviconia]|uniref:DNA-directed RNA polymerase subunit n=1 Tax=Sporothrix curviconia TaxID=1260050 RepID=A0ABP0AZH2_9PEZI
MADVHDRKRPHADDATPRKAKKAKESRKYDVDIDDEVDDVVNADSSDDNKSKKSKKDKKEKKDKKRKDKEEKKDKKSKKDKSQKNEKIKTSPSQQDDASAPYPPENIVFPFYTQTVSLWIPLFPLGFDKPITSAATQHLDGFVNHYASQLGGYLLAYRNVNLADKAARASPTNPPTDATPATLTSVDEYAVGFGWMTADVDLFVPSRGAWLEGTVILQNEGAIGVSCWDKFNASIEAARLPKGWQYVELEDVEEDVAAQPVNNEEDNGNDSNSNNGEAMGTEEDQGETAPAQAAAAADTESVAPLQATGYWVDADGMPVEGKIRFRIKDFDVGLAGDNGYLAIEGTMLREDEERALRAKERARSASKRDTHGIHGQKVRRLPEFSITQFGKEEEEEESGRRVELYKGSRPGTPGE